MAHRFIKKGDNSRFSDSIVSYVDQNDSSYSLGAGIYGIRHLLRNDNFPTQFVEIPKDDYIKIISHCNHGFRKSTLNLNGNYPSEFFFKGLFTSDSFKYLYDKNLLQ